MKKVAFMFVAAMAMSFAACTGNKTAATDAADTLAAEVEEAIEVVEEVADTTAAVADSVVAEAEAVVAE